MSLDSLHQLAAGYVLGTLSAERRRVVESRQPFDADLRDALQFWEDRLRPLTGLVEPVEPSPALWLRIEASLPAPRPVPARHAPWRDWWSSLAFWRVAAVAGLALAAFIAVAPMVGLRTPAQPDYMVVLVAPDGTSPGWVVQTGKQTLRLVPLARTDVPEQRALQFWTKADGWAAPLSLGLVQPGQTLELPLDQLPPLQPNQLFEITLEPATGSPTGKPTGPVLYIGRSVRMV